MKNFKHTTVALCIAFTLNACSDSDSTPAETLVNFDAGAMVDNLATNIILAGYQTLIQRVMPS